MSEKKAKVYESLGRFLRPEPPPPSDHADPPVEWAPRLTPTQQRMFDCNSKFILGWSEKGAGKTAGGVHKLIKHCYDERCARAVIGVKVRSMATMGGAWDKLLNFALPTWRDGNRDRDGNLLDEGIGLVYTDQKIDLQHNVYLWIKNRHGLWSLVVLISVNHGNQLRERMRGIEPSFVLWDELTSCDSPEYFRAPAAQLGRVRGIVGPQQFIGLCNPDSQDHWVYQTWFVKNVLENGELDPNYEDIYFPVGENLVNLQPGYYESLKATYRDDPIEAARMVDGEWKDRPDGSSLFAEQFNEQLHIRPLTAELRPRHDLFIRPHPNYPIVISFDPGQIHSSFVFMQWLPVENQYRWVIFDEVVSLHKRIFYETLIPAVMRRLAWWVRLCETRGGEMSQVWISDNSAFNQFRPGDSEGYDVLVIERIYEQYRHLMGLSPMKVRPAPKFSGSQVAMVREIQRLLSREQIIVSSRCKHVRKMFTSLRSKQKPGASFDPNAALTPRKCKEEHTMKAMGYGFLTASLQPQALVPYRPSQQLISVSR